MMSGLINATRGQTLHSLSLETMVTGKSSYTFQIASNIKQSRPGYKNPAVKIVPYPVDRRLCPVTALTEYLKRTANLRSENSRLFLSYLKPHKEVSKDTISRWIRTILVKCGSDVTIFKPHSIRAAAASKAQMMNVPVDKILDTAGWSSCSTFAKYYNKPVQSSEVQFAEAVLK